VPGLDDYLDLTVSQARDQYRARPGQSRPGIHHGPGHPPGGWPRTGTRDGSIPRTGAGSLPRRRSTCVQSVFLARSGEP